MFSFKWQSVNHENMLDHLSNCLITEDWDTVSVPVFVLIVMLRTRSATLTGMDLGEKSRLRGFFSAVISRTSIWKKTFPSFLALR